MLGGGLQDHELIILAARPGCGKSALALNIAQFIAMSKTNPQRTDIFSLEMSAEALLVRALCGESRVSNSKFRSGYLNKDERYMLQMGLNRLVESPMRIHDQFKRTLGGLIGRMRSAVKGGSKLILIDYAQLLVTGKKTENRNLEIGEIGRSLKMFTLEYGTPIMLLSQVGRSAEKRQGSGQRPQLSDLKDSGTLEEHADTVMTIFRPELYSKDRADLKGVAELDILKQRNGECGRIPLRFIGQYIRFESAIDTTEYSDEEMGVPVGAEEY
jgi:replicative DNA helicase